MSCKLDLRKIIEFSAKIIDPSAKYRIYFQILGNFEEEKDGFSGKKLEFQNILDVKQEIRIFWFLSDFFYFFPSTGWSGKDIVPQEVEDTNKASSIGGSAKSRTQNWVRTIFKGESYFNLGNSCLGRIMSSPKHPFIALLRRGGENEEHQASWSQLEWSWS